MTTPTLRDRVLAMADVADSDMTYEERRVLALAVAAMVAKEMLALADDLAAEARHQLSMREDYQDTEEIERLHAAIRARKEEL